jgi:hypothetical protein
MIPVPSEPTLIALATELLLAPEETSPAGIAA